MAARSAPPNVPRSRNSVSRRQQLATLLETPHDVLIIGGGINGAVTASALAARGARVALIDRGDFASETSMQSSNLVWGGIKYLETFEFGLVQKLCRARNALLRAYPTTVREIRFLATVPRGFRLPHWLVFLGAWLYWLIGACRTRRPLLLSRRQLGELEPLIDGSSAAGGFEYSDAWLVDGDARFVFGFVRDALGHGACALNYVEALGSTRQGDWWQTEVRDARSGHAGPPRRVRSRVLLNAAGPYADAFNHLSALRTQHHHLLSKGVHLIVRQLGAAERVLAFFATDGRLFFVLPFGNRSCIGTTDTKTSTLPPVTTDEDRAFILSNANRLLRLDPPLSASDVIAERCGVRPLAVRDAHGASARRLDWTSLSRKHIVEVDAEQRLLHIFGGKLTDCLNVGEEVCAALEGLGIALEAPRGPWFGEASSAARDEFLGAAASSGVAETTAARLWRYHGPEAQQILQAIARDPTLGRELFQGTGVLRAEAVHAGEAELVERLEDFVRRRTQLAQCYGDRVLAVGPERTDAEALLFSKREC